MGLNGIAIYLSAPLNAKALLVLNHDTSCHNTLLNNDTFHY